MFDAMVFAVSSFLLVSMQDPCHSCMRRPQFRPLMTFLAGLMLNSRGEKSVLGREENGVPKMHLESMMIDSA